MSEDPRAELASIAAALGAYLEQQRDSGATGIPRGAPRSVGGTHAHLTENVNEHPNVDAEKVAVAQAPRGPRSLAVIEHEVAGCTRCQLSKTRKKTVFARGNPAARLCFIGEAPGADEDEQGLPFVGRAGQLLDRMIAAMGLVPESDVYVCNIIKCRPPGNRKPEPEETASCIPYLHEQLAAVAPKVIVAMGNTAVGSLLGTTMGITKLRGEWKLYKGKTLVMPTYHPSYLLRPGPEQQPAKKQAWEDLQKVMKELGLAPPKKG